MSASVRAGDHGKLGLWLCVGRAGKQLENNVGSAASAWWEQGRQLRGSEPLMSARFSGPEHTESRSLTRV